MKRVGFLLKVKPDMVAEYRERHRNVWPEMQDALRRHGWHNYSLFLRDDGLLFGYLETPDSFQAALDGMNGEDVNGRWQQYMKDFFEAADRGSGRADENMVELQEVFHLE